jgi:hypothetical protein
MNEQEPRPRVHVEGRRCGWIVASCVVFGVLMGGRAELQSVWVRSMVAGLAGAALALAIAQSRK